ncbi:MAG: rRNA maturation RNase YbeY [Proteobacteria bacterium]|nr:rRNA maturation RNase YbeY [Pseudomonadota bacterium]
MKQQQTYSIVISIKPQVKPKLLKFISQKKIKEIISTILETEKVECTEISILFTGDKEIQKLNATYRRKDKPTDVLSFPLDMMEANFPKTSLGDLIISVETAIKQAKEYGVTVKEEITRLLIHGTLHLLGYDHEKVSKAEAEKMRRREKKLLAIFS